MTGPVTPPPPPGPGRPHRPDAPIPGFAGAGLTPDELDRQLDDLFGPVARWWVGELPGLGVMRLPLP